jgi:hypothetical protein
VFTISSPTALENEKVVQSGFHMYSTMTKDPCMFFLPPPTCSIVKIKTMYSKIEF